MKTNITQLTALNALCSALKDLGQDASVRPSYSQARGIPLGYYPVKVGWRSPITVYEVRRGQFEDVSDAQVRLCFCGRPDSKAVVGGLQAAFAAFAAEAGLTPTVDPGDDRKRGWLVTPSQIVEVTARMKGGAAPLQSIQQPTPQTQQPTPEMIAEIVKSVMASMAAQAQVSKTETK
jgi:hypothetical protein